MEHYLLEFHNNLEIYCEKLFSKFCNRPNKSLQECVDVKTLCDFFLKPHFDDIRQYYQELTASEQKTINDSYINSGLSPIEWASKNALPFLQSKILCVFQDNNFNNQTIYLRGSLNQIGKTIYKLYEFILSFGEKETLITKNEYNDLMSVLNETIKLNSYMS